ncbi:MAG: GHMP kinase, partial [Candidatus Methylomirabilales bacterium]
MRRIVAQAPTRIDFAGGTLDLPPLYLLHEPVVTVNVAIDLPAVVTITERADRRVTIISRDRGARRTWTSVRAIRWDRHPFLELGGRLIRAFNPPGGLEMETACLAPAGAGTGGSSALAVAGAAALARLVGRSLS